MNSVQGPENRIFKDFKWFYQLMLSELSAVNVEVPAGKLLSAVVTS